MKKAITEWCQDVALMLGLYIVLRWTGLESEWFHWVLIPVALFIYGIVQGRRAIRWYQKNEKHVTLTPEEFDKWLISHGCNPRQVAKEAEKK